MKEIFEADIVKEGYSGYNGWVEDIYVSPHESRIFDQILESYVGKKVKITIEEIDEID